MKSILLKLVHQGYEFIAFALCCGFVASFVLPIGHFLLFTVFAVFADTVTGLMAAKKQQEPITSTKLKRTIEKIVIYFVAIMIFRGAEITFKLPVPITYMTAMLIASTELWSIAENTKKMTGVNLGTLILRFFKK